MPFYFGSMSSGRWPMALRATAGVMRYGPSVVSRQICLVKSALPPVSKNERAPLTTPIDTEIALAGRKTRFPAVTPTSIAAISIVSCAFRIDGERLEINNAATVRQRLVLAIFSITLPSQEKFRAHRIDTVCRIPVPPHAEIVAAAFVVEIIIEAAQCAILKANPGKTGAARHGRSHTFHHHADSPVLIAQVGDFVADAQKKALPL
jgi:hypothetical protein